MYSNNNKSRNNGKRIFDDATRPPRKFLFCHRQKRKIVTLVVVVFIFIILYHYFYSVVDDWLTSTSDTVIQTGFVRKNISACKFVEPKFANDGRKFLVEFMGIRSKTISFESVSVFYREAKPPKSVQHRGDVLLLHGAAFSSQVWVDLGTMQILASSGYRVVAIDQPGFNRKTSGSYDAETFLDALSTRLSLRNPAVISPSASGRFSVPYVVSGHCSAFVPVAPCCTSTFLLQLWQNISTPTLIIHGQDDKSLPSKNLLATPNHVFHLTKAGHSVYMDQTELFHTLIINFFNYLTPGPNFNKC